MKQASVVRELERVVVKRMREYRNNLKALISVLLQSADLAPFHFLLIRWQKEKKDDEIQWVEGDFLTLFCPAF